MRVPPEHAAFVKVRVEGDWKSGQLVLFEPRQDWQKERELQTEGTVLILNEHGEVQNYGDQWVAKTIKGSGYSGKLSTCRFNLPVERQCECNI